MKLLAGRSVNAAASPRDEDHSMLGRGLVAQRTRELVTTGWLASSSGGTSTTAGPPLAGLSTRMDCVPSTDVSGEGARRAAGAITRSPEINRGGPPNCRQPAARLVQ